MATETKLGYVGPEADSVFAAISIGDSNPGGNHCEGGEKTAAVDG